MKIFATYISKVITSALLLSILLAGALSAQGLEPPESEDPSDLFDLPLQLNMDNDDINWEADATFFPFEGAALERIENPDASGLNETSYVMQYKKAGGQPWAGFFYHTEEVIPITDETMFNLKVWSHEADVTIMMKLEMRDAPDVETPEMHQTISTANEWVELEWDLSDIDRDTPWDRVVIIADLTGPSGDGSDRFTWFLDDFNFSTGEATSNEPVRAGLPQTLQLNQNYPNPFNPTTKIEFALPETAHATLNVYDMLGQRVATLVDRNLSAGNHSIDFNASNLSSGMYIYQLRAGNSVQTRKLTLIK